MHRAVPQRTVVHVVPPPAPAPTPVAPVVTPPPTHAVSRPRVVKKNKSRLHANANAHRSRRTAQARLKHARPQIAPATVPTTEPTENALPQAQPSGGSSVTLLLLGGFVLAASMTLLGVATLPARRVGGRLGSAIETRRGDLAAAGLTGVICFLVALLISRGG
ncbi:MAG: hypothetical protein WBB74_00690 [Gaiellaceae bacterium]